MPYVYKNIASDKNQYAMDGWDIMPIDLTHGNIVAFKDITIPFEDEMVQELIKQYESDDWQKYALSMFKKYFDSIGYTFTSVLNADTGERHIRIGLDDQTRQRLCTWRVEMDFNDGYLRLSPFDVTFPYSFYNKKLLDRYAPDIVESLKKGKMIRCARISS